MNTMSNLSVNSSSMPLWDDLGLERLLDSQPLSVGQDVLLSSLSSVPCKKINKKHRKMMDKPTFNILMGRYNALPNGPSGITPKAIARLADPIRGRFGYDKIVSSDNPNYSSPKLAPAKIVSSNNNSDSFFSAENDMIPNTSHRRQEEEKLKLKVYGIVRDILSPNHTSPIDDHRRMRANIEFEKSQQYRAAGSKKSGKKSMHPDDVKIRQMAAKLHIPLKTKFTVKDTQNDSFLPKVDFQNSLYLGAKSFSKDVLTKAQQQQQHLQQEFQDNEIQPTRINETKIKECEALAIEDKIERDLLGVRNKYMKPGLQVFESRRTRFDSKARLRNILEESNEKKCTSTKLDSDSISDKQSEPNSARSSRKFNLLASLQQQEVDRQAAATKNGLNDNHTAYLKKIHSDIVIPNQRDLLKPVKRGLRHKLTPLQQEDAGKGRSPLTKTQGVSSVPNNTSELNTVIVNCSDISDSSKSDSLPPIFDAHHYAYHEQHHLPWMRGTKSDVEHAFQHAHDTALHASKDREYMNSEELEKKVLSGPGVMELLGHHQSHLSQTGTMGSHVIDNETHMSASPHHELNAFLLNVALANSVEQDGWEAHQKGKKHRDGINTMDLLNSIPGAHFDESMIDVFKHLQHVESDNSPSHHLLHQPSINQGMAAFSQGMDDGVIKRLEILTQRIETQVLAADKCTQDGDDGDVNN